MTRIPLSAIRDRLTPEQLAEVGASTESKFGNQPTVVDGIRFASKREANRWRFLRTLERTELITNLRCQVRYHLSVNEHHICDYIADFVYVRDGRTVVEDAKGVRTPAYRLKKRLMWAVHGIEIKEV